MNKDEQLIAYVDDRLGHTMRHSMKSDKIEHELGWNAKWDFSLALKETIDWYMNN